MSDFKRTGGGYYLQDVTNRIAEITALCPEAKFERFDYGFRLIVRREDGAYFTVMQPARPADEESGFGGQDQINRPAAEAVAFLRDN